MCDMQTGINHEQSLNHDYERNPGWYDPSQNFCSIQNSPPIIYENMGFPYWPTIPHCDMENFQSFSTNSQKLCSTQSSSQSALPMTLWPSMLTASTNFSASQVSIPPSPALTVKGMGPKHGSMSSPRKTLTDNDRRRMCLYHEENPTVKQTEIGAIFGVERSTVSKVLRQKVKYLSIKSDSSSPIKRTKGKLPDIERALSNWVRNLDDHGVNLPDEEIRSKARFFASTVGPGDNNFEINSSSWLEKFKQKNKIGSSKSLRRGSEIRRNHVNSPTHMESDSVSHPSCLISPTPPPHVELSPKSSFSASIANTDEDHCEHTINCLDLKYQIIIQSVSGCSNYFSTAFSYSPENSTIISSEQSNISDSNKRIRSQPFPKIEGNSAHMCSLRIHDPLRNDHLTPESLSANGTPNTDLNSSYSFEKILPQYPLSPEHYDSSTFSSLSTSTLSEQCPLKSMVLCSPTQDDATHALEILLKFFSHSSHSNLVDTEEYLTILKLTQRIRSFQGGNNLPTELHQDINEQNG